MNLGGGEGEDEDIKVKNDEEVNQGKDPAQVLVIAPLAQVPASDPILVLNSNSEVVNDLDFPKVQPAIEDVVGNSFNQGSSLGSSLNEEEDIMAPMQRVLGKKKAVEDKVAKPTPNPVLALPILVED